MEISSQLHAPAALPPGKQLSVPIGKGAGWRTEKFLVAAGNRTPVVQSVA